MPRKTKKQKLRARLHQFEAPTFQFVKREFNNVIPPTNLLNPQVKSKESSIQNDILASTKKDLAKTFVLASTIFVAELVLYFLWQ